MKTQISRNSFKAKKRYAGVYQQQGRMLTDADWNNLVDILKGHLAEALKDVAGTGSPRDGALKIKPGDLTNDPNDLTITPGDLYVDGLRASLPDTDNGPITVTDQPDFPGAPDLPDFKTDPYVVYADVWERSLTALEDPELRDAGLGGADTCTRTRTMLQVKTCPEGVDPENDIPRHGDAALTLELHGNQESGDPCDPCAGQVDAGEGRIGNYLFRLEVHLFEEKTEDDPPRLVLKWSSENGAEQYDAEDEASMPPGFVDSRYMYEFFDLTTEQHAGVHLAPGFPIPGILKTAYVIPVGPSEPKDFVRRWDGYCELVYIGSAWSPVVGWDKGVDVSTVVADGTLRIKLEALSLALELGGARFVAGDYWSAPVREAEHLPGDMVIEGAPPEGIVHHYLRLARVAADGTVSLVDDDADRRRHEFPPLTDLRAPDVGYETDCSSGLFDDGTYDNVEKALNRLCELAAEHVHYEADCGQGLFQNFIGTVKEALDRVCAIQARDVGFAKPCDTSVYQGQTVATVEDALTMLCDVKADQIAYQPQGGCTFLNQPGIDTVQEALDALCVRPAGGGCKVTVGEGGVFNTLEEAIEGLLSPSQRHICLCLLPGTHLFGGEWRNVLDRFNLSITGCGAGSKVILEDSLTFIDLTSLKLENFAIDGLENSVIGGIANDFPLTVERCSEVDISNIHHVGLANEAPLIRVIGGERVRLEENILEAYTGIGLIMPQNVFDFDSEPEDSELVELYAIAQRDDFLGPAGKKAAEWAALDIGVRETIAGQIRDGLIQHGETLTLNETVAYHRLRRTLFPPDATADADVDALALALLDGLREVRDQAHHAASGSGVVFMDASANVALEDNTIFGSVSFYGDPGTEFPIPLDINSLKDIMEKIQFMSLSSTIQAWDNRITRLAVGAEKIEILKNLSSDGNLEGLYRTALLESNILAVSRNHLLFENLTLAANEFQTLMDPIGWVVGKTAIYTGNRVRETINFGTGGEVGGGQMQTAVRDLANAANLPRGSWDMPP